MRPKWLYDSQDQTWHLWPQPEPVAGDEAYCGNVKDADCTVHGEGNTKCQACIDALRSSQT